MKTPTPREYVRALIRGSVSSIELRPLERKVVNGLLNSLDAKLAEYPDARIEGMLRAFVAQAREIGETLGY